VSSFFAVAAGFWGLLMSLAPLLQVRAILRLRSSAGVSLGYMSVLFVGFVLWLSYGLSIGNPALIATNIASIVMCAITITVTIRFRPHRSTAHTDARTAEDLEVGAAHLAGTRG
jgi:MtN3 and saliva related transmembrane protein